MPEILTPISEEWVVNDDIANRIITNITLKAILEKVPVLDSFVLRDTIFGVDLTYQRVVIRSQSIPNSVLEFRYALYTKTWVLEMIYRPCNTPKTIEELVAMWTGRGDKDRWLKDATLIKLSGV